ncbi:hypothetical protein [Vibrio cholerae]|uniref:hypothetical protein n=1 Tax=Vibrio cholerae TaxID=666 RepID=UPI0016481BC8|nr:hypothetical protein [Vibrio cholerae]
MDNNTLWQLTTASVSDVQSVNPDDRFREIRSFAESVADVVVTVCSHIEPGRADVGLISRSSEHVIRNRKFELHEFQANDSKSEYRVFMVR